MIYVAYITEEQAEELKPLEWADNCRFNPMQDEEGNWFISEEEVIGCVKDELRWVRRLPIVEKIEVEPS